MVGVPKFADIEQYLFVKKDLDRSCYSLYKTRHAKIYQFFIGLEWNEDSCLLFLEQLRSEDKAPNTINNYLKSLRHIDGYLRTNVTKHIDYRKVQKKIPGLITEEQFRQLLKVHPKRDKLQHKDDRRYDAALLFVYVTGCRNGEICNLTWDDFFGEYVVIRNTKNDEDRTIWLQPSLAKKIETLRQFNTWNNYIFGTYKGKMAQDAFNRELRNRLELANLKGVITHIHELRHSCATHLAEKDVPIAKMQAYMGHRDPKSTMKYVHFSAKSTKSVSLKAPLMQKNLTYDGAMEKAVRFKEEFIGSNFMVSIIEDSLDEYTIRVFNPHKRRRA